MKSLDWKGEVGWEVVPSDNWSIVQPFIPLVHYQTIYFICTLFNYTLHWSNIKTFIPLVHYSTIYSIDPLYNHLSIIQPFNPHDIFRSLFTTHAVVR